MFTKAVRTHKWRLLVAIFTVAMGFVLVANFSLSNSYLYPNRYVPSFRHQNLHTPRYDVIDDEYNPPVIYPEHDILQLLPFKFNPPFKNPCWYERWKQRHGSRRLRCLPYFYLIGVKKSGTSDLFFRIMQHPDMVHCGPKEAQWFPRKRFEGDRWKADIRTYIDIMSGREMVFSDLIERKTVTYRNTSRYHPRVTGDGTPANLHMNEHWKLLPGNEELSEPRYVILDYIRHITPNAKLIILFRDPIDRLYSEYFHVYSTHMKNNTPSQKQFHDVVIKGIRMYEECLKVAPLRACVYEGAITRKTLIQIQLGLYSVYWRELLRVFPRENILYLHSADCIVDKRSVLEKVFKFLDMGVLSENDMIRIGNLQEKHQRSETNRNIGPMWNTTRELLFTFYKPFTDEMVQLTEDDKFKLRNL